MTVPANQTETSAEPRITVGRMVNWQFAGAVGTKLAPPAPLTTDYTRRQAIDELADAARRAEQPVREVTGLADGLVVPDAQILDRPGWIRAAADSMRVMSGGGTGESAGFLSGRIAGAQTGAVLAFVSSGILGQYDPFHDDGAGALLLVYPNVIAVERQLQVNPSDFRMWVCLHEVTHRVQFSANPWLGGYMSQTLAELTADQDEDLAAMLGRLGEFVRSGGSGEDGGMLGLVRAMQSDRGRQALDRLLVLGTLLEGHADHVMDAVGPAVVPSVSTIRSRFEARRSRKQPVLQRLIRALIGMDAKMRQYTRGKRFVDEVVGQVGMARFNRIWTGPDTLPLPAEIEEPDRWISRVL